MAPIVAFGREKPTAREYTIPGNTNPQADSNPRNTKPAIAPTPATMISDPIRTIFVMPSIGSEKLTLKHPNDIVLRKSAFTCSRTIAIKCDKASDDIPRKMVKKLQNPKTTGKLVIEIK